MNFLEPNIADITGRTRMLGILAYPTDHVKAPPAINRIARARGRDAVMVPLNVAPRDLGSIVRALRVLESFDGAIVTVPHKQAIVPLCDSVSARAAAVGAVNVVRRESGGRLVGDQLDGIGFMRGMAQAGISVTGKRAYLAGAGGAANAIAFALGEAGLRQLTIANRTPERAIQLLDKLGTTYPEMDIAIGTDDPSGHQLVINATALGMHPSDPLPLDIARLSASMTVAEVVMAPEITPLLAAARRAGAAVHLGHHMLDHQLQLMADFLGL